MDKKLAKELWQTFLKYKDNKQAQIVQLNRMYMARGLDRVERKIGEQNKPLRW